MAIDNGANAGILAAQIVATAGTHVRVRMPRAQARAGTRGLRKQMARELGVDEGTLAGWENGKQEPRGKWLKTDQRILGDI